MARRGGHEVEHQPADRCLSQPPDKAQAGAKDAPTWRASGPSSGPPWGAPVGLKWPCRETTEKGQAKKQRSVWERVSNELLRAQLRDGDAIQTRKRSPAAGGNPSGFDETHASGHAALGQVAKGVNVEAVLADLQAKRKQNMWKRHTMLGR